MSLESDKWGWKHVSIVGEFHRGSGSKRWKCNHCNHHYNGSYSRVRSHLLGFRGMGVQPCPAIEASSREAYRILDEDRFARKLAKKNKSISSIKNTTKKPSRRNNQVLPYNFSTSITNRASKDNVDVTVARFFYGDGLDFDVASSSYFREMVKALGAIGCKYELPSTDKLSSLLSKEKVRLEKVLAQVRESWPYTGCTILCVNRLDGSLGCFCVNFFVASPRGIMFLKEVDIIEGDGDGPDNQFINELATAITEVGTSNVVQVITHLNGQTSDAFESVILSKFPRIFWSHCTSHSVLLLMEEIAELDWMKPVVSCAREIEQSISAYQSSSSCTNINILKGVSDPISQKFAASFSLVRKIFESKAILREAIVREEWKQWRINNVSESAFDIQGVISKDDFWDKSQLMLEVYEPFLRLLVTLQVDIKSVMGSVYNWRVQSLEALRSKNSNDTLLNQLESLLEKKWDKLFSPLHGAAYMLHPRYLGEGQSKDKTLMQAWNATLERYEPNIEGRRVLREELGSYWREEGSFGETDVVDCRDKMAPVTWWENFGFETPCLQTLAIKILSQIPSSVIICEESWQCDNNMTCKEAVGNFGLSLERAKDFVFVRNNLRLQSIGNSRKVDCQSGSGDGMFCQGSDIPDGQFTVSLSLSSRT